ncbi:MAG: PAS domain-containing protein [Deltaproteobacteria bacterium]|nr:PAS domain-containing protein [Deltaproteobacteria bacterium]MBW2633946.1 PAS domain-containing protein [Deltaproteobacteria bacterium]MBW2676722.1 PAS domain-containing protein [Deltaproteobacteria bacterium]
MGDVKEMLESLNTAVVACDADFKVTYANEKCKQMFKASMGVEGFVGSHMRDCHKPETMKKLEKLFAEYKEKKRNLYYYTLDTPDGKLTIVNVPSYEGDTFAGVMEFLFEGSLA